MDILTVVTLMGIVFANIGTSISLFIWATNRSEENRKETNAILVSIQQEMKDFHGRLERADAEFKAHILSHHKGSF